MRRISRSLFVSERENKNALDALADIKVAHSAAAVVEQIATIDEILDMVLARESGRTQLQHEDRKSIEDNLANLEERLVGEIERRKVTQRRDLVLLACLLAVCLLGTLTAGLILVIRPVESASGAASSGLGLPLSPVISTDASERAGDLRSAAAQARQAPTGRLVTGSAVASRSIWCHRRSVAATVRIHGPTAVVPTAKRPRAARSRSARRSSPRSRPRRGDEHTRFTDSRGTGHVDAGLSGT